MVRSVTLNEEALEALSAECKQGNGANVGVLLGNLGDNRDVVVDFVKTPGLEVIDGRMTNDDADLIVEHARMVRRMVPGGVQVMGLYIVAHSDRHKELTTKFFPMLQKMKLSTQDAERLLVQICARTHKPTCKSVDVVSKIPDFRPAEIKTSKIPSNLPVLATSVRIDLTVRIPQKGEDEGGAELLSMIAPAIAQLRSHLEDATPVLGGKMVDLSAPVSSLSGGVNNVEFYCGGSGVLCINSSEDKKEGAGGDAGVMVTYSGVVVGCAHVYNPKSTTGSLVEMLRQDIADSVQNRISVLSEDYDISVDEGIEKANPLRSYAELTGSEWSWALPRRVFAPHKSGLLTMCDYVVPQEDFQDCVERFRDMLHIDYQESSSLPNESLAPEMERNPRVKVPKGGRLSAAGKSGVVAAKKAPSGASTSAGGGGHSNMVPMIAAAVAGLGALVVGSMYT